MKSRKQAKQTPEIARWDGSWKGWLRSKHAIAAFAVFLIAAVLMFAKVGQQMLWQDEAQTALVARTILQYGTPHGYDGQNYFSQEAGAEYGKNYIWKWHTWLQFYVIVPFFLVLGKSSTLAARLPFAIFGLATIVLIYFTAAEMWRSWKAGLFAAGALTLSVPFLLLARQCRYYSPAAFFTILTIHAYLRLIDRKRSSWLLLVVAGTLLFQTFYLYCITLVFSLIIHALIFHRDRIKDILTSCGAVVAINLPWIVWLSQMSYGKRYSTGSNIADFFGVFLHQIWTHILNPYLLVLPVLAVAWSLLRQGRLPRVDARIASSVGLLIISSLVMIFTLSATSPAPFFRYLAPILPIGSLITALLLDRIHWSVGIAALVAVALWSPLAKMNGGEGQKNDIFTYVYEITHDYVGPVEGTVKYLKEHAKKGDVVTVTYEDLPLKYYTNLRIIGGLTGEDLTPASEADWIVMRRYMISSQEQDVRSMIYGLLQTGKYRQIDIPYPDIPFQNRETPDEHLWRTEPIDPPRIAPVAILKRIDE